MSEVERVFGLLKNAYWRAQVERTDELVLPDGWRLELTAMARPEQYDLFDEKNEKVGYFRLRWGSFTVTAPWVDGIRVYHAEFDDGYLGQFLDDASRRTHLQAGVDAVKYFVERGPKDGDVGKCSTCGGWARYVEYTMNTIGDEYETLDAWWSHFSHPVDNHDAVVDHG